jgi:segregation and condensation protein B|tara:strand:+ start:70 stop:705 length:636 start_codon:yes stop_codon:yes gene_type:complete
MESEELKSIVENVLLAADQPINAGELCKIFLDGTDKDQLQSILDELKEEYSSRNLQVTEVADGYQLCTRHEYNDYIRKFLKLDRSTRLSQPSLDTLSIIAYKQPLTRQEVDEIRGVDSSGVIKTLLEKKVIGPAGRKKVPGRPIMYRTTQKFLEYFGLKDLSDLPTLEDLREVLEGEEVPLQTQIEFSASEASEALTSEVEPVSESGNDPL